MVPENKMFVPVLCQAALFFAPDYQLKPLAVATKLSEKLSSVFSVEPSTVALPPNVPVPLEIPRVILQGDPNGQITVSPMRADIAINLQANPSLASGMSEYITTFASCFDSVQIVRVGFVLHFTLVGENILAVVKNKYILPGKLSEPKELYFGWVNKLEVNGLAVNRFINFSCNSFPLPDGNATLMVDTNTLPEVILDLQPEDIRKFVDECLEQYRGDLSAFIEW